MARDDEVGIRLDVKGRREAAKAFRDTEKDIEDLGDQAKRSGPKLKGLGDDADKAGQGAKRAAGPFGELKDRILGAVDGITGADFSGLGDKLEGLSRNQKMLAAGATVGTAVGGALVAGMLEAVDREAIADRLGGQLGVSEAESERLGGVAGRLYADAYGDSFAGVADSIAAAVQTGIADTSDEARLERLVGYGESLSSTFGVEVVDAFFSAQQLVRNGLAPDVESALDLMAGGLSHFSANLRGEYLESLDEYSTLFRGLGIDAQTATGLMIQGLQGGARNVDIVADALKEFQIRAQDGSALTQESFQRIGLNAEDMGARIAAGGGQAAGALDLTLDKLRAMEDPVERNAAAVGLFGTQAEDLAGALFSLDPTTAVSAVGDTTGAMAELDKQVNNNAQVTWTSWSRTVQDILANAGKSLLQFGTGFQAISNFAGNLDLGAIGRTLGIGGGGGGDSVRGVGRAVGGRPGRASPGRRTSGSSRPDHLATGGPLAAHRWAVVGEEGPELVRFGVPAVVTPADETARMLSATPTVAPPVAADDDSADQMHWYPGSARFALELDKRVIVDATLDELARRRGVGVLR